jgi:hypothetical protein
MPIVLLTKKKIYINYCIKNINFILFINIKRHHTHKIINLHIKYFFFFMTK